LRFLYDSYLCLKLSLAFPSPLLSSSIPTNADTPKNLSSMAAATNGPKIEANVDGSFLTAVKPEPGSVGASPAAQSEDDIYEDTGDLDFAQAGQDLWLCRIPKFLFENWKDLQDGDDEQIRIGTVRVERDEKNKDKYKRVCSQVS
jgi:hypothetical protein